MHWFGRNGRRFDWSVVRALGNLQILTRVSYASLIVVPVLAGVWGILHRVVDRLLLPFSWVLTFFAAVAVALGHTLYQVAAPQLIREKSRDDFISERLTEFAEDRPDRDDQLLRALGSLREIAKRLPHERHPNFVRRHGDVVWLPSELDLLTDPPARDAPLAGESDEPGLTSRADASEPGADRWRMRLVIDEGARARYDLDAHDQMHWAWVAGGLYGFGLGLIALILIIQSVAVLTTATGWKPLYLYLCVGVAVLIPVLVAGVWQLFQLRSRREVQLDPHP